MRKANNNKSSKEKSTDRKVKKVSAFVDKASTVYTVLHVFKENISKHKQAWEDSIKYDDGYLQPYYKGLLTQIINKCNKILDYFKNNGFELKTEAITEVEEIIERELGNGIEFENNESKYTQDIMLTALQSLFCTVSFKKFHRNYNEIRSLEFKFQEIIDITVNYFDFFERDIQSFECVK